MEGRAVSSSVGRARVAGLVLVVLQVLGLSAPAAGAPLEPRRDKVDGGTYFTWDAETGTFPPDGDYGSAMVTTRGDRVRFFADAKPVRGAEAGERLLGTLTLRLKRSRPVRYRGTFTFVVRWGDVVFHRLRKEAAFTLRPTQGKRRKVLRFPFDLDSDGTYAVTGRFSASS